MREVWNKKKFWDLSLRACSPYLSEHVLWAGEPRCRVAHPASVGLLWWLGCWRSAGSGAEMHQRSTSLVASTGEVVLQGRGWVGRLGKMKSVKQKIG